VILARGRTRDRGKMEVHATDVKNQSICCRRGTSCISPGITSPFNWQFNQAKVTDYVIENQGIMKIAPCLVSILSISIKVKISH
jgi:hypothetical protein